MVQPAEISALDYEGNIEDKAGLCNKNNVQIAWQMQCHFHRRAQMQFLFIKNAAILFPVQVI